jgi:hypothetical protein
MSGLNWVGVLMQVVGLVLAMFLLLRLRELVTGRAVVVPWGRIARRKFSEFARRVLRRPPPSRVIDMGASGLGVMTASGHVTVTRGAMPAELSLEERVQHLDSFVRDLEGRSNALDTEIHNLKATVDAEVGKVRKYAEQRVNEAVDQVRAEFRLLVGQDIAWEVLSLVLVAVGVVLAVV